MDNYARVEKLLHNYNMLKVNIANIRREIDFIKNSYGIKGVNYDKVGGSSNETSNPTQDAALRKIEEIKKLESDIRKNEVKLDKINKTLEVLTDIEREVLVGKYIESKQWWEVAASVRYSERHCRNIRRRAVLKMAAGIFGD